VKVAVTRLVTVPQNFTVLKRFNLDCPWSCE
jgi:hypothetical protein